MQNCDVCRETKPDVRTRALEKVDDTHLVVPDQATSYPDLCDHCLERVERGEIRATLSGELALLA